MRTLHKIALHALFLFALLVLLSAIAIWMGLGPVVTSAGLTAP